MPGETNTHTIPYETTMSPDGQIRFTGLLDTIRLSLARTVDTPGASDVEHFDDLPISREEFEGRFDNYGAAFDSAIVNYLSTAIMARRSRFRGEVIVVETDDPEALGWQRRLENNPALTGLIRIAKRQEALSDEALDTEQSQHDLRSAA